MTFTPKKIIIHCSVSSFGDAKIINKWHKARGFREIGYHKVILNGKLKSRGQTFDNLDGQVEDGRPLTVQGAHCKGQNRDSIGICLIGIDKFTNAQYRALARLCMSLMKRFNIPLSAIHGHYEFSKKTCPNFDVKKFIEVYVKTKEKDFVSDEEMIECLQIMKQYFNQSK